MPDLFEIGLDELILDEMEEGKLFRVLNSKKDKERCVHYDIKHIRELAKNIYKLYSNPKTTKKDFVEVIKKHAKKSAEDVDNFFDQLTDENEEFFRIVEKKEEDDVVTVKFKKIDSSEKLKVIKSIAKKLSNKVTKKQMKSLFEEAIRNINDVDELKEVDKKLDEEDVDIEERKGCFYFKIGDKELRVLP